MASIAEVFVDGPVATGKTFFGREDNLNKLSSMIFDSRGIVSLVGPTRIGKTSLAMEVFRRNAGRTDCIQVFYSMGSCMNAYDFFLGLSMAIRKSLIRAGKITPYDDDLQEIVALKEENGWFIRYQMMLEGVLEDFNSDGLRLILAIDEFDAVTKVFKGGNAYLQMLRSIYYYPDFATSGVVISRRSLWMLEDETASGSSFHAIFNVFPLGPFDRKDMNFYYERLSDNEIHVSEAGKRRLDYYTGRIPYLCCKLGVAMLWGKLHEYGEREIDDLALQCKAAIEQHDEDLIRLLDYDHLLDPAYEICIGVRNLDEIEVHDLHAMENMGILQKIEEDGKTEQVIFSHKFMDDLASRKREIDVKDALSGVEGKIRSMIGFRFPALGQLYYPMFQKTDIDRVNNQYNIGLDYVTSTKYCKTLSAHKTNPTVLDVITISKCVEIMQQHWNIFFSFFGDDVWVNRYFRIIVSVRNAVDHGHEKDVSDLAKARCIWCCQKIVQLPMEAVENAGSQR